MFLLSQLYEDVDMDKSNRRIALGSNQGAYGKYLSEISMQLVYKHSNTFNDNNMYCE